MTEYLGASGPVVNSPTVDKGTTALAMNINLNSYMEKINKRSKGPSFVPTPSDINWYEVRKALLNLSTKLDNMLKEDSSSNSYKPTLKSIVKICLLMKLIFHLVNLQ